MRHRMSGSQLQADAVSAGNRAYALLNAGVTSRFLLITVTAILTVTVNCTGVKSIGSVVQAFDEMGIDENGNVEAWDPRLMLVASQFLRPQAGTYTRAAHANVQTTTLKERFLVPFEYAFAGNPAETRWREQVVAAKSRFFYKLNGTNNGIEKVITVGAGTATLTSPTVTVEHWFNDDEGASTPLYRPSWEMLTKDITSVALSENRLDIYSPDVIRGITIFQDTNLGGVTDVLGTGGIQLRGDKHEYIGKGGYLTWDEFALMASFESAGDVYASFAGGAVHYNLQKFGRLGECYNPAQDTNLRLMLNALKSATGTSSQVKVLLHKLQRKVDPRADGKFVTAPDAEFRARAPGLIDA